MCMRCVSDVDAAVAALGGAAGLRVWTKVKLSAWREKRTEAASPQCRGKRRPEPEPKQAPARVRPIAVDPGLMGVGVPAHRPDCARRHAEADERVCAGVISVRD